MDAINKEKKSRDRKEYHKNYYLNNKETIRIKNQQRYLANSQEIRDKHQIYYKKNVDKIRAQQKKSREQNKETRKGYSKKYYQENREKILKRGKEREIQNAETIKIRKRKYYKQNKEKIDKRNKQYAAEHKSKMKEHDKKYRRNNSAKITARKRNYEQIRIKTDPVFKMIKRLRTRLWSMLKSQSAIKSASTLELLGTTKELVWKHLESLFKEGMTRDNHGNKGWHIDHIKPISSFDLNNPEQLKKCCHYTNLQPLWWWENLSKSDKIIA